jgi:hypothetical protein
MQFRQRDPAQPHHTEPAVLLRLTDGTLVTVSSLEYADDVALPALSEDHLQKMVTAFGEICDAFGLTISTGHAHLAKTKVNEDQERAAEESTQDGPEEDVDRPQNEEGEESDYDVEEESRRPAKTAAQPLSIWLGEVKLDKFCYLGSILNSRGTLHDKLAVRAARMHAAFALLEMSVYCNRHLSPPCETPGVQLGRHPHRPVRL